MGEIEPNRPARLLGALTAVVAAGLLLTSCAGVSEAGAGGQTASAPAEPPSSSAPAPSASTPAPSETASVAPSASASASASKAAVEPFVTSTAWDGKGIDIGALVPKVVESGGICTARAERDGTAVEQSGPAVAASSYTGCPQLVLKGAELVPGTWTVTVSYSSDTSAGTSKAASVTVR